MREARPSVSPKVPSFLARSTNSSACAAMSSGFEFINAVKRSLRTSFPSAGDFAKDSWKCSADGPSREASSGIVERK